MNISEIQTYLLLAGVILLGGCTTAVNAAVESRIVANKSKSKKTSFARLHSNGTQERPTITIGSRDIVVTLRADSGATVRGARLQGSGGDCTFTTSGPQTVQPGTYRHFVFGSTSAGGPGVITSKIEYG
jgi:hypothetical protein